MTDQPNNPIRQPNVPNYRTEYRKDSFEMTDPRPVCDSETMRAFEAEIERASKVKADEQEVESTATPGELSDTTPFARKLREMEFWAKTTTPDQWEQR